MAMRIDSHVPPPASAGQRGGAFYRKYPFPCMKVGDSFFVPSGATQRLASAAYVWVRNNRLNWKFVVRQTTEDDVSGCRVWRIK